MPGFSLLPGGQNLGKLRSVTKSRCITLVNTRALPPLAWPPDITAGISKWTERRFFHRLSDADSTVVVLGSMISLLVLVCYGLFEHC